LFLINKENIHETDIKFDSDRENTHLYPTRNVTGNFSDDELPSEGYLADVSS